MLQGLSHFVLHATTVEDFENTSEFYTAFGFKQVVDNDLHGNEAGAEVWLRLTASENALATDIIIRLVLHPEATAQQQPPEDEDWSLSAIGIVLAVSNADEVKTQLEALGTLYQDQSDSVAGENRMVEIYALDPLDNVIVFTTQPSLPSVLASIHRDSVETQPTQTRRKIGVLTSGGDAPGMNASVRAVVRYGISKGCDVFGIYEGYQGLVDGGNQIRKMDWKSVRGWLVAGGTNIGTARCMAFKTREGRLQAAQNLVEHGIDALIVCGGDGSLTGADVFRSEWHGLLAELRETNRITTEAASACQNLTIVGLVGSIDNDMSSTDITIGCVTSLHRICESVDSIGTTALSHSRAFVIEVMGRHCGWLALMAGIATGADFVFIPERPPTEDDWESVMCSVAHRHRQLGKRKTVIIVAEGAIDKYLNPIRAEHIKDILTDRLGLDTRVTTLGHTQRGGSPCAFDRILATIQSVEAVEAVLRATPDTPSPLIGLSNNKVTCGPLMKAVELTHEVAKAISEKNFARAMELRDPQFAEEFEAFNASTILDDGSMQLPLHQQLRMAILHVGAPAGGMNAATRTAVRYALNRGHKPLIVYNGFPGLIRGTIEDVSWIGVDGWTSRGGSELGTNRAVPGEKDVDMGMVAYQLQNHNIQALMVIGGFEAFSALVNLEAAREKYPSLCIPICHLPATISNNVPGTDYSLGSDTSLNAIVASCDSIIQSARSSRRRVFVVEVQGGKSGYLAVEAGLATGANTIYIPEEGISLSRLQSDVQHLMALYLDDDADKSEGRIILRNETVSKTYTTEVISSIIKDEGHALFDSRTAILGHIQQGNVPSPMDRIRATRLAMRAVRFMEHHSTEAFDKAHEARKEAPIELTRCADSAAVIGISGADISFLSVQELLPVTDAKNRKPKAAWWYDHRPLVDLLAGRGLFAEEAPVIPN
ncbi:6-phosphofructokinase, alpha subunit [Apophysomyces sp. BC1034]|nr:6-phosphofructokinase, alpha subunit [Apophysomyces sp. BC1015]KAG0176821.1 6-phosphofructokinase, alpha subunit [Apophysomyces sp. BC1021]KAG0184985.1 6-phosphofructokinase, alpha subunit [Apophysomyces sp. BC1034]